MKILTLFSDWKFRLYRRETHSTIPDLTFTCFGRQSIHQAFILALDLLPLRVLKQNPDVSLCLQICVWYLSREEFCVMGWIWPSVVRECLPCKPESLSLILRPHSGRREPISRSCPLTSISQPCSQAHIVDTATTMMMWRNFLSVYLNWAWWSVSLPQHSGIWAEGSQVSGQSGLYSEGNYLTQSLSNRYWFPPSLPREGQRLLLALSLYIGK